MTGSEQPAERNNQLVSQFVDGDPTTDDIAQLSDLLRSDAEQRARFVDHLLLDSLLAEEVGTESLAALVDLVAARENSGGESAIATPSVRPMTRNATEDRSWKRVGWLVAAAVAITAVVLMGRWETSALASASTIVRAAMHAHSEPIERVYVVQVERVGPLDSGFTPPQDARVATQGSRFYVEMNRGERRWVWGRDQDGAIWLTLGAQRAMLIAPSEVGAPLQAISDVYSLDLESLLLSVLQYCRLEYSEDSGASHVIAATPLRRWPSGLRQATIEVDKETKAVRRLVIERELPKQITSRVIFTLVDSRVADNAKYQAAGHLAEPFRLLTRDSRPDLRRELLVSRFGRAAEQWIKPMEASSEQPQTTND